MLNLPPPILNYVQAFVLANRSPAYLLVAKDGSLLQWGGDLTAYGIMNLHYGDYVEESILFLQGMLPINDCSVFLPGVNTDCGLTADVHLFSSDEGNWILLLDATQEEEQRLIVQQNNNNLSLLWQKHFKIANQHLKHEIKEIPLAELLTLQMIGEYKEITTLSVGIHLNSINNANFTTQTLFNTFNLYFLTIVEAIINECGTVSSIFGDTVTALFGIIPTTDCSQKATKAAFNIIYAIKAIGKTQHNSNLPFFSIGIGIASGKALLGILHNQQYQKINAIGHPVNLALHLKSYADSSEILIDETTFNQLAQMQHQFSEHTFLDKGANDIKTYSCLL